MEKGFKLGDKVLVNGKKARIIDVQQLAEGKHLIEVFFPDENKMEKVVSPPALIEPLPDALTRILRSDFDDPLEFTLFVDAHRLYFAYTYDPFLVASTGKIDALPHQIEAVTKILSRSKPRFLLADDVGLGKTIMAGMVIKELESRKIAKRILIIVPAGLREQWKRELNEKFREKFIVVDSDFLRVKKQEGVGPWLSVVRAIVSMDLAKRNDILEGLRETEWDLIIVDEAHKLTVSWKGDSIEKTDRYKLGEALSDKTRALLFLTATPHNGEPDDFFHRIRLLEPYTTKDALRTVLENAMIRRLKREVFTFDGKELFPPRQSRTVKVSFTPEEDEFYWALTNYVRSYYGLALERGSRSAGLALTILQRRVASSMEAAKKSLQRRLQKLMAWGPEIEEKMRYLLSDYEDALVEDDEEKRETIESQLLGVTASASRVELQEEIRQLKEVMKLAEQIKTDSKAEKLLEILSSFKAEAPELKIIVFTEYRDTLFYLLERLKNSGFTVASIHGLMKMQERVKQEKFFKEQANLLVGTDAAGEGLNLQFANIAINYELPWNPNRIEQRIGRVHRYGQKREVIAFNFLAPETIEGRIFERLLEKIEEMKGALGERVYDVIGILLSERDLQREIMNLVTSTTREWEAALSKIDDLVERRKKLLEEVESLLIKETIDLDKWRNIEQQWRPRLIGDSDVERFATIFVHLHNGKIEPLEEGVYRIEAPRNLMDELDEEYWAITKGSFRKEIATRKDAEYLSLGHPLVRAMMEHYLKLEGLTAAKIDLKGRKGFFFAFKCGVIDEKGYTREERLATILVDERSAREVTPEAIWALEDLREVTKPDITVEDAEKSATQLSKELASSLLSKAQEKAEWEYRVRRDSLETYYTDELNTLRERVEDYERRAQTEGPQYRSLAERFRTRMKEFLDKKNKDIEALEVERRLHALEPKLIAVALIVPKRPREALKDIALKTEIEEAGMKKAMEYEMNNSRTPSDVSELYRGYDIESQGKEERRYIEVKAFATSGPIELTAHEWLVGQKLQDDYWLYAVENALTEPALHLIKNPYENLKDIAEKKELLSFKVIVDNWKYVAQKV
jgi:superfamily II DNA or RNA helicase